MNINNNDDTNAEGRLIEKKKGMSGSAIEEDNWDK